MCVCVYARVSVHVCISGKDTKLGSGHPERCDFLVQALHMQNEQDMTWMDYLSEGFDGQCIIQLFCHWDKYQKKLKEIFVFSSSQFHMSFSPWSVDSIVLDLMLSKLYSLHEFCPSSLL